jgi:hypothetical protein
MNNPITTSYSQVDLEKQIVFRAKRLIRVRRGRHIYATNLLIKYDGLGEGEAMKLTRHHDRRSFKRYTNKKEIYAAQIAILRAERSAMKSHES